MRISKSGFTVVELLTVIVVMGILASITVVVYNGIQGRAYASTAIAARSAYVKALKLYRVDNGRYPIVTGGATVCLGAVSDYPAKDGFASGQCKYSDYGGGSIGSDATITADLKRYISLPSLGWPMATETYTGFGKDYYRGIFYYAGTEANQGADAYVWYYLPGSHTCPTADGGYGSYDSSTGETQCTILIR
jgi:prepilin-type N-terminal cleavage/methylation domain-containing protein